jgi:hypothetical protein
VETLGPLGLLGIGITVICLLTAFVFVTRSLAERRRLAERRLISPPDSGVGLTKFASEPEPDLRTRFDNCLRQQFDTPAWRPHRWVYWQ